MIGFISNIGPWELVMILLVALIVVGPGKLPDVARSLGKAINQFQKATSGVKREIQDAIRFDEDIPSQSAQQINIKPDPPNPSWEDNIINLDNSEHHDEEVSYSTNSELASEEKC